MFSNQPAKEGTGYTDDQLRNAFPQAAGITGDDLAKFQKRYNERAYDTFVRDAQARFDEDKITGTPTYIVSGQQLQFANDAGEALIQPTEDDLLRAVTEAWNAGGKKIES